MIGGGTQEIITDRLSEVTKIREVMKKSAIKFVAQKVTEPLCNVSHSIHPTQAKYCHTSCAQYIKRTLIVTSLSYVAVVQWCHCCGCTVGTRQVTVFDLAVVLQVEGNSGDLRKALEICCTALEIVERKDPMKAATPEDINLANRALFGGLCVTSVQHASEFQRMVLLTIMLEIRRSGNPKVNSS